MYYFSKNSRKKVIHLDSCFHCRAVETDNIGSFHTLEEAYEQGYRLCRHCSPLVRLYRREGEAMAAVCLNKAITYFFHDRFIGIETPRSKWKIVPREESGGFALYHKNTYETSRDSQSAVPGYHLQRVSKESAKEYLEYVVEHEYYRMRNPLEIYPIKRKKEPPRKGTKRYRKQQKRAKWYAKHRAAVDVLRMIDGLSAQRCPTAATA